MFGAFSTTVPDLLASQIAVAAAVIAAGFGVWAAAPTSARVSSLIF